MLAILTAYLAAGTAASVLDLDTGGTAPVYFTANLALTVLVIALLTRMRWWTHVGFRALDLLKDLRLYWVPSTLVLVNVSFGIADMSIGRISYYFLLAGMTGFVEESVFRGPILRAIAPRGLWQAAIISSILFGLLHSLNVLSGADPLAILLQIGYALAIGFGFAAVTLRTQVIWPLVLIHALTDFAAFVATDGVHSSDATTTAMLLPPSTSSPSPASASSCCGPRLESPGARPPRSCRNRYVQWVLVEDSQLMSPQPRFEATLSMFRRAWHPDQVDVVVL